ncbi:MAG: hypothetical protein ACI4I9_02335 [Porcipelethomonas sp.]
MLHRSNPADKHMGYVYLNYAGSKPQLSGDVIERVYNGKTSKLEEPDIKEKADSMCVIKRAWDQQDKDDMSISYVGDKISASYDIYDENFNLVSENSDTLKIPGNKMPRYYVGFDVKWGEEDENVTVRYYFAVEFS